MDNVKSRAGLKRGKERTLKSNIAVKFNGNAANIISDAKKGTVICKQPFKKEPDFSLNIDEIEKAEVLTEQQLKNKSVIGRAVIGGILFGGVGAVVGGISGTGQKTQVTEYLSIETTDGKVYIAEVTKGRAGAVTFDIKKAKERKK